MFESTYLPVMNDVAAVMEDSFYWINSVDRFNYDTDTNVLTFDITVDFEGVYGRNFDEWSADTWDFFTQFGRDIWGSVVEGLEGELPNALGDPDWTTWAPGITLNANTGRLSVECPGSVIDGIRLRQVSQADYEDQCQVLN